MFGRVEQKLIERENKIPVYKIKTKAEKIFVWFCGDLHYGNEDFDSETFNRYLDWAKENKNVYTILMGDMIEIATADDFHAKMMWNQRINPQEQLDDVKEMFMPLKGRIIACTNGNHEDRASNLVGLDVTKEIADHLDCAYIPEGGYVIVDVNGIEYKMFMSHGSSSSCKPFAQLEKANAVWDGTDITALGHVHQMAVAENTQFTIENGEETKKTKYLIRTGAFLNYPSYAKKKFYPVATIGSTIAILYTDKKVVSINISGFVAK